MKKIYLANGLFNESDLMYNEKIYNELIALGYDVYAPQKNASINDKTASATSIPIYEGDTAKLKEADILVAVLDGIVIDPGVASEVGWVAGWNESDNEEKLILGLYTDTRDFSKTHSENKDANSISNGVGESQYSYVNLYTVGCCKKYGKVFNSLSSLIEYLKKQELLESYSKGNKEYKKFIKETGEI